MNINGMEVTDVIVFPIKNRVKDSKLSAFAKVIINDQLMINGMRIVEGKNGPFVTFPSEWNKEESRRYDICRAITPELKSYLCEQVLNQYSLTMSASEALAA